MSNEVRESEWNKDPANRLCLAVIQLLLNKCMCVSACLYPFYHKEKISIMMFLYILIITMFPYTIIKMLIQYHDKFMACVIINGMGIQM